MNKFKDTIMPAILEIKLEAQFARILLPSASFERKKACPTSGSTI